MGRMFKLLIIAGLFLFPAYIVETAGSTPSDFVRVKVTVTPSISVSITEDTLTIDPVAAGGIKASVSAVTVTNDGSGVPETYSLSLTNPTGWTASQTASGVETYVLNAAFDGDGAGISWSEVNHALSTTPVPCTNTKFAGDQTGVNVPGNAQRTLWFQFKAPTATTLTTEQEIRVTVTAQ